MFVNSIQISFNLNGENITLTSKPNRTLLDVLREDFKLVGAKDACSGVGECGACTVLVDGKPVNSCLILIGQIANHAIVTIEGLVHNHQVHPIQQAFMEAGAVQCGFCTPGMILSAKALLDQNLNPTDGEIKEALAGNLCRCTGYIKIVKAVHLAAEVMSHA